MNQRPYSLHWLFCLVGLLCLASSTHAQSWLEVGEQRHSLGQHLSLFATPTPISLNAAIQARTDGAFQPSQQAVPRLGIGSPPHWLYLPLYNPMPQPVQRTLQIGEAWVDQLDVYLIDGEQRILQHLQAGDGDLQRQQATPGMGYLLPLELPAGYSELYVQVHSADALILPIRLLDAQALEQARTLTQYSYGALYGFLLALLAYNLMLYAGLRERNNLNYSIYLGAFILLNLSYTGHAGAWLWPESVIIKRYAILLLMGAMAWLGLHFARHFLELDAHAPRLARAVHLGSSAVMLLLIACAIFDWHALANQIAFISVLAYTLLMVLLGLISLRHGRIAARYFLAATLCGMFGTALTDLAVWGAIPFNTLTYRAVDIGILLEATLLALALAYQMRQHQQARHKAETLARIDPLTGLLNRRAFLEQGNALWNAAQRHGQPLAVIMLDLDHFKDINDQYGHDMGDKCLVASAGLLSQQCRTADILARWGGEEFLLLLPSTSLEEALQLAERLRQTIAELIVVPACAELTLSASLGVADSQQELHLEAMINSADKHLYQAKQTGRNRVCGPRSPIASV